MSAPHILFICVANSARSQMAEAIAQSMAPANVHIASAGSAPSKVNPLAIRALNEIEVDVSHLRSKGIDSIDLMAVTHVITLCAEEHCPVINSNAQRLAWTYPDPAFAGDDEIARLEAFRAVRDDLLKRLPDFLASLVLRP